MSTPNNFKEDLNHTDFRFNFNSDKIRYKGKDGRDYSTLEELNEADKAWKRRTLTFKGRDGNVYSSDEVGRADRSWKDNNLWYLVDDAELGRREIAPGAGDVRVCTGYRFESDPSTGKRIEVPVYVTRTF